MDEERRIMKRVLIALMLLAVACSASPQVEKWEHGWKIKNVIATEYKNPFMGENIGFVFPNDPQNCDRIEIDDFIHAHKGDTYQSGGYPGAEMFVIFEDVKDKASADKKLQEILPGLDRLIVRLR